MAYSLQDTNDLTSLGDAIRAKTGGSSNMTVAEMATAVAGISSSNKELKLGNWNNTATKSGAQYYKQMSANATQTFTMSNVPTDDFYVLFNCSTSLAGAVASYLIHHKNGTTTMMRNYGVIAMSGPTISVSYSDTTVTVSLKFTSTTYLFADKSGNDKEYMHLFYAG